MLSIEISRRHINFLFSKLFAAFGSWNLPLCMPFATFWSWKPFMFHATHSFLKLEPSILHTICSILYIVGTLLSHAICSFLQLEPPFCLPVATFGSWNLPCCLPVATFGTFDLLHDICIRIFAYMCNILELESSIWHAICKLLLVVLLWLLSVSCGFLFVLLQLQL